MPSATMRSMIPVPVENWFQAARSRWPTVDWPVARYIAHLGSDRPKHPEDVFLGGAASERMQEAWEVIHLEVRPEVLRRVTRVSRRSEAPEDLWAEALARLISDDSEGTALTDGRRPARIRRFRGMVPMPAYIAVVAKRIAFDQIRKSARVKLGLDGNQFDPGETGSRPPLPQEEAESMELADRFAVEFASAFRSLTPTRQALLSLVYGHGMGKADAGRVLGMRDYEVSRELGASIRSLRDRLDVANPGTWTHTATERWTRAWAALSESTEGGIRHDT